MQVILFADNDRDFLDTRAEFLEQAGYQVLKAYTLAQARQLLAEARVHLAILDIRMEDDKDERDVSGLTLAKDPAFRSVPKIILTNFPSYQYVRKALGPVMDGLPPAVDFLSKQEGPEALIQAVKQAFAQHVRINPDLHILRWNEPVPFSFHDLVTRIQPEVPREPLYDRADELEDLFRRLFHDKRQITVGQIFWHRGGRVCQPVIAYSSEGVPEQGVVTCGIRSQIEQEIAHYEKYAPKGRLSTISVEGPIETVHFAAAIYALRGADLERIQNFTAFYQVHRSTEVKAALRHLFDTTLAAWHQDRRFWEERTSLDRMYRERLGFDQDTFPPEKIQQQAEALAQEALRLGPVEVHLSAEALTLRFPNGSTNSYPNPIPHLYEEQSNGQPVVCRITPGMLNGTNILVDPECRTWVTDFAQAGPAPLLWDFVSIEATVRFHLVHLVQSTDQPTDLQALHEFEKRLVAPSWLDERLDTQDIAPRLRKALGVINEIRNLAYSFAGSDPMPYYKGLLFHALREVVGYKPNVHYYTDQERARLVHALLAAAMIWAKISENSFGDSPGTVRGIQIDESGRRVMVEGRWVTPSATEFDVLLYLYNHAGQVCSRRSIVEEVLEEEYTDESGRINTLIARLRKRIEPDPERPRYIITVRGKGYVLYPEGKKRS